MIITPKYGLSKPSYDDFCDVSVLNENTDAIESALSDLDSRIGNKIVLSAAMPADWSDDSWWFEEIEDFASLMLEEEIKTIAYDSSELFHLEIAGNMETISNATDNETTATETDFIII